MKPGLTILPPASTTFSPDLAGGADVCHAPGDLEPLDGAPATGAALLLHVGAHGWGVASSIAVEVQELVLPPGPQPLVDDEPHGFVQGPPLILGEAG